MKIANILKILTGLFGKKKTSSSGGNVIKPFSVVTVNNDSRQVSVHHVNATTGRAAMFGTAMVINATLLWSSYQVIYPKVRN